MKITILSRSASIPSTRRLVEAARARGHQVRVLNPGRVEMHLDGSSASLYYKRKKLPPCDVVIPRIAQSINSYGLAVVNQFEIRGMPLMNTAQAIAQSRNKMRSLQLLSANGIDIPATVMARDAADLKAMVGLVGGVPVLVKLLQGQEKHGVMVCESLQSLEAALEAVLGLGHNLVVQQYVQKSGHDVRVLVVGGRAVAAVERRPRVGRLSHTLIKGARLEGDRADGGLPSDGGADGEAGRARGGGGGSAGREGAAQGLRGEQLSGSSRDGGRHGDGPRHADHRARGGAGRGGSPGRAAGARGRGGTRERACGSEGRASSEGRRAARPEGVFRERMKRKGSLCVGRVAIR